MFKIIASLNRAIDKVPDILDPIGDTVIETANISCLEVKRVGFQRRLAHVSEDRELFAELGTLTPDEQAYVVSSTPRTFPQSPAKLSAKSSK